VLKLETLYPGDVTVVEAEVVELYLESVIVELTEAFRNPPKTPGESSVPVMSLERG
jgi:hypothetical protein